MTKEELKAWRDKNNLTAAQAANRFGATRRAWHYWESGERKIPKMLIQLINTQLPDNI
jgi:DNA-binding transcriptional regulator YiaG